MRPLALVPLALGTFAPDALTAQRPDSLAADVRQYVVVDTAVVALSHVLLVDGTGAAPKPDQTIVVRDGRMAVVSSPDAAKRFVAYWAAEGATWIKAYADIRRAELGATIEEAHKRGIKVTGHLCSVSFQEAVALGIDNLEHGMLTASDFAPAKQPDVCPVALLGQLNQADPRGEVAQATIRTLVQHKVSMTSTLAVYEPFVANRPTKDARVLQAMAPEVRESYSKIREEIDSTGHGPVTLQGLQSAMAFEKAFVDAGGLLAAGVDPTGIGGALAGFGDQRNYELFIEAGFTPAQAVRIMTANGAKILGVDRRLGTVERGKLADLVVLRGDLAAEPSVIRNVTLDGSAARSPRSTTRSASLPRS